MADLKKPSPFEEFQYRLRRMAEERGTFAPGTPADEAREALRAMEAERAEMGRFAQATSKGGEPPDWWKKSTDPENMWEGESPAPKSEPPTVKVPKAEPTFWDDMAEFLDDKAPATAEEAARLSGRAAEIPSYGYMKRWGSRLGSLGRGAGRVGAGVGRLAGRAIGPLGVALSTSQTIGAAQEVDRPENVDAPFSVRFPAFVEKVMGVPAGATGRQRLPSERPLL